MRKNGIFQGEKKTSLWSVLGQEKNKELRRCGEHGAIKTMAAWIGGFAKRRKELRGRA
jgi:hypothetical protein